MTIELKRGLRFDYPSRGYWFANSQLKNAIGVPYTWRINVCRDGNFDVSTSDKELCPNGVPTFATLDHAIAWCDEKEDAPKGAA